MINTKQFSITLIFLLLTAWAVAQDVETKITSVTVYRHGALVGREGKINVPKGTTTLYINGLSTELDPNTLRIGIGNQGVKILSGKHEITVEGNDAVKKQDLADDKRIATLKDSLTMLAARLGVLSDEENLIRENRKIGGEQNGVSTSELVAMTNFYKKELSEIAAKKISINKQIQNHKDEVLRLMQQKKIRQKNSQQKNSRVKLVLESSAALSNVKISMSYLVFNASWEPFYEVRVNTVGQPLDLVYGAHLNQSSTEDWNNVRLTISTGDPSIGNDAPEFYPMYLPPEQRAVRPKNWTPPSSNLVFGIVTDENLEPLPGVTIYESDTKNGTITDMDGKFQLAMLNPKHDIKFTYIGFNDVTETPSENMHVVMEENTETLEQVVVIGYGTARPDSWRTAAVNDAPRRIEYKKPEQNVPLQLNETQSATEFSIELPYTIPADGKVYDITMLTYNVDADYRYSTLPRQSPEVFLLADLKNFSQYPLLKGSAYVYLENVYQGECEVAPDFAADTLSVSVGRDKDIAIKRQAVKELTSKKFIGSSIKVQKCFEITIKNNKSVAVDVEIMDQYPLPKYSDIKVDLTDKGGATVDSEQGKLTWKITLNAQEKRTLRFCYEVKYPRSYDFSVE